MSLIEELEAKKRAAAGGGSNGATAPGRDPARVREEYDRQAGGTASAGAGASTDAGAGAGAADPSTGRVLDMKKRAEAPSAPETDLPSEVQEQLDGDQPPLADQVRTTEPPDPKAKKGGAKSSLFAISIADERTGRLLLHAVGIMTGREPEDVEKHCDAIYGAGT